ncbi:RING-H2 zinc finger protein [Wolffia australiana]
MMPPRCNGAFLPSSSSTSSPSSESNTLSSLFFLLRNWCPGQGKKKMTGPPSRTLSFSTPDSLSDWLRPRLPAEPFSSWGVKPGTKTVHNLWLELAMGETALDTDLGPPLLRTVRVASVRIRNARGEQLVESHQLLSDGSVRWRRRSLSEKMKPGESAEDAAARAVAEELGGRATAVVRPGSVVTRVEERASASYPGLPARYVVHFVEAEVAGVPQEGEFSTEERGESAYPLGAVSVLRHFWKWVADDPPL